MNLRTLWVMLPASLAGTVAAANLYNGTPTPIKEPACIADPDPAFVLDQPAPEDRYILVVRHMDSDALSTKPSYDYGALGEQPLTGFHPDVPRDFWQRAKADVDANYSSAFQLQCADAGMFINTWRFEPQTLIDEGPHAAYTYAFSDWPPIYDGNPDTDFVLQASLEVPWLYRPAGEAIAQIYFQARFFDASSGKPLQMTLLVFANEGIAYSPYVDYARNDSLFVSAPLTTTAIATRSPYSYGATAEPWTGLRFFRAQITPANFGAAVALVNQFCARRPDIPDCAIPPGRDLALSRDPADYRLIEFSVITEVFNADTGRNGMSVGMHLQSLGAFTFR